jgi:type IV fimbrial biogenesis protein FimT
MSSFTTRATRPRPQRGISAIENLVAAAVVSTLAASAAGQLANWRAQLSVTEMAAALETDLQFARSQALARQQTVHWTWEQTEHGACWIVFSGPRQACRCAAAEGPPECSAQADVLRSVHLPAGHPVTLSANAKTLAFDATLGTVSPGATVRLSAPHAKTVHQVIGIMGRVRSCVPGGGLAGYRAC